MAGRRNGKADREAVNRRARAVAVPEDPEREAWLAVIRALARAAARADHARDPGESD